MWFDTLHESWENTRMIELRTFTPAEAAKISGVNATLQRDWRRRGFLPKEDGPARFRPFAVAEMMAMNALAQRGIGPQQSKLVSNWLAAGLIKAALQIPGACDGDFFSVLEWDEDFVAERLERKSIFSMNFNAQDDETWVRTPRRGRWIADRVLKAEGMVSTDVRSVFFWWADGTHGFYQNAQVALDTIDEADDRRTGAVIMLDLNGLAALFLKRVGGPVATITLNSNWRRMVEERQAAAFDEAPEGDAG